MKGITYLFVLTLGILLFSCSGSPSLSSSTYIGTVPTANYTYNPPWNPYSYTYRRNSLNLYYNGGYPYSYRGGYPNYFTYPSNIYSSPNYYDNSGSLIEKKYHKDYIYRGY